jgi:two-component system response regulator RegX3
VTSHPLWEIIFMPGNNHDSGQADRHTPNIFILCDRPETAQVWAYIIRQKGFLASIESPPLDASKQWGTEIHDLVLIDVDGGNHEAVDLCRQFRAVSVMPILVFLPAHHETHILDAYSAGADEVIVKPISPPVFLAKVMAWMRRSWVVPIDSWGLLKAGSYHLDATQRTLMESHGASVKLTNLEFRLLHLLMSCPGQTISLQEIIDSIWGGYGSGDQAVLKNLVYRLRRKIETDPAHPRLLVTERGGYSFSA